MTFQLFSTILFVVCLFVFVNAGDVRNLRNNNAVAALQQHVPEGANVNTAAELTRPSFVGADSQVSSILADKIQSLVLLESTKSTQNMDERALFDPFGFNCKKDCITEILRNAKMRVFLTGRLNEDGEDDIKKRVGKAKKDAELKKKGEYVKLVVVGEKSGSESDDKGMFDDWESSAITFGSIASDAWNALSDKEDGGLIKMFFVVCTEGAYMVIDNIMQGEFFFFLLFIPLLLSHSFFFLCCFLVYLIAMKDFTDI